MCYYKLKNFEQSVNSIEPTIPVQRHFMKINMNFSEHGDLEEEVNPLRQELT
jgi:hypothetical protein